MRDDGLGSRTKWNKVMKEAGGTEKNINAQRKPHALHSMLSKDHSDGGRVAH